MGAKKLLTPMIAALASLFLVAGCATGTPPAANQPATTEPTITEPAPTGSDGGSSAAASGTVTLVTTNSFAISDDAVAAFEAETGLTLNVVPVGSAGVLASQLVLTKDHPLGDAFFGVDNTFASRLTDNDVAAPFTPSAFAANELGELGGDTLTPVTRGDVCLNIDLDWFAAHPDLVPPTSFVDLLDPFFAGKTIVLNPATSSPGRAFLLATIAEFGDAELGTDHPDNNPANWQEYWRLLLDNRALVLDSWSQAYFTDFSASGGERPIVVSYASSPAATLNADGTASTTAALLDTCFSQVEFAGILNGAANPEGAAKLIEFLVGAQFQSELPTQMWVYPIVPSTPLPDDWARFTTQAPNPIYLGTEVIETNQERWLEEWNQIVLN